MNEDVSTYESYEQTVENLLAEVGSQLEIMKQTGVVPGMVLYTEYSSALNDWGNIGNSIMKEIKAGNRDEAIEDILNECTPALG